MPDQAAVPFQILTRSARRRAYRTANITSLNFHPVAASTSQAPITPNAAPGAAVTPRARSAVTGRFVSTGTPEARPRRRSATFLSHRRRRSTLTRSRLAQDTDIDVPPQSIDPGSPEAHIEQDALTSAGAHIEKDALTSAGAHIEKDALTSAGAHIEKDALTSAGAHIEQDALTSAGAEGEDASSAAHEPEQGPKEQKHSSSSSDTPRVSKRRRSNRDFTIYDECIPEVRSSEASTVILDQGDQEQSRGPQEFIHQSNNPEQQCPGAPRSPRPRRSTQLLHDNDENNSNNEDGHGDGFVVPANVSEPPSPSPLPRPSGMFAQCTSPLCPVPTLHDRGLYLHNGSIGSRYRFGMSNPPPEVWEMVDRLQEGNEQPGDQEVVDAFARNHRFQAEIWTDD